MKYASLGDSGIQVSRICGGCMSYGEPSKDFHEWTLNPQETEAVVKNALRLGINFFDTANTYSHGTSEEYLGRALKNNVSRQEVVIATKVFFNKGHLSREAILREIDASLRRLGTDYVDLYIIHRFDYRTPMEETMETLDSLIKAGKVRAIGASSMYGYQFMNLQRCAEQNGWAKFCTMENHYNLLYREEEREMIPICKQMNVALMPYGSLAAGRLARREWKADTARSRMDRNAVMKYDGTEAADKMIAERVAELAERRGVPMAQIALAWQYAKGITSPIVGATRPEQYEASVGAVDLTLSEEEVGYLEELYLPHRVIGPAVEPKAKKKA